MDKKAKAKRLGRRQVSVGSTLSRTIKGEVGLQTEEKNPEIPASAQAKSKQLEVAKLERQFRYTKDHLVKPELSLDNLVTLYKQNYAHFFCVNIKAACVSGVGFRFIAVDFNEQEITSEIANLKRRKKEAAMPKSPPTPVVPDEDTGGQTSLSPDDQTAVGTSTVPQPDEGEGPLTPEEEQHLIDLETQYAKHLADRKHLALFFSDINPDESFTNINSKTDVDKESIGFACWEISRNGKQEIDGIWHMPSVTVRMMNNNIGVCQIQNSGVGSFGNYNIERGSFDSNNRVFFKKIGLPVIMDSRNGNIIGIIDNPGPTQTVRWINMQGEEDPTVAIPLEYWANEVIIQRKYNPENFWYGMPDIVAALDACAGDKAASSFQEQFFDNNAVPRMAVVFKGVGFDDEVESEIQTYFEQDIKGNNHSVLVIEIPGDEVDQHGKTIPGADIKFEKLAMEVTDASFRQYRKDNCDQIVTAHRVPGSLLPIQGINFNRDTGMVDLEIFKSQVIRPIQSEREFIINKYLVVKNLGITTWEFRFNEIDSLDELRKMQIYRGYIESNVMTLNEVRRELGLPAKKGGDVLFKITPMGLVKIEDIEDLTTGDLSAQPATPLAGADQGGSNGGRPPSKNGDQATQSTDLNAQNAVAMLEPILIGKG